VESRSEFSRVKNIFSSSCEQFLTTIWPGLVVFPSVTNCAVLENSTASPESVEMTFVR